MEPAFQKVRKTSVRRSGKYGKRKSDELVKICPGGSSTTFHGFEGIQIQVQIPLVHDDLVGGLKFDQVAFGAFLEASRIASFAK